MKSREQAPRRAAHVFVLTYCLLAGGIVTSAYFYYWHFAQHYRAKVEQDLATIGDLKVGELARFRHERLADAAILFKNDSISALVRRFLEDPKDADARRQLETLMGKYNQDGDYDLVRLLDAEGDTRLSVPAGVAPVSSVVLQSIPQVLRSGQVTLEDFHRNEHDQRIYLDLLIPILPEQGAGRPLGIFYLRIDPEIYLYPAIARWPIPSATAESTLVRRDGSAVLYLSELRTRKGTALTERVPLTETRRTAVMAVVGREGIVQGVAGNGNPVVAYVRAVPDSPWFVVLRQETGEAYAPVREQLWLTIALAATLLAGLGAGFGAMWRGERVRLYRERAEAAEALHQSEERYLRLFESNPYPAWVYDLETLAFLAVNPAALDHYGYSRDEFLTMTIKDIRPAEDQPRLAENLAASRQQLERAGVWRHRKKDGTVIDVEITSHTLVYEGRPAALVIPIDITERERTQAERERLVAELQGALARVKTLSGLVPICSWCKKIRDDGNYWHQVETYVSEHTDATFSHGVCPECMKKHYPEFEEDAADAG